MDFIKKFNSLFEKINNHSYIECDEIENIIRNTKSSQITFVKLKSRIKYNLNIDFLDCILLSRGKPHLNFFYNFKDGGGKTHKGGGEFYIKPLSSVLLHSEDPKLWHDKMNNQKIQILKTFRIIDDHPESGDFKLAAFSIQEGINPPKLPDIYFYDRGEYNLMDLDYKGYLGTLLDLIGVSNWQYLFCDINMNQPKYKYLYNELHQTLKDLEFLFPKKNYSKYFKLLDSKQK